MRINEPKPGDILQVWCGTGDGYAEGCMWYEDLMNFTFQARGDENLDFGYYVHLLYKMVSHTESTNRPDIDYWIVFVDGDYRGAFDDGGWENDLAGHDGPLPTLPSRRS